MSLWDAGTINRFMQQGEDAFASTYRCIVSRVALSVIADTADYAIPDELIDIRRITWKGKQIHPLPKRYLNEFFQGTQFIEKGEPRWFIYNGITAKTIRLFPTPNETVTAVTTGLFDTEIKNRCIIEYFQLPDYATKVIPPFFRRRLLKSFILNRCFRIEGSGQNLKNAKYHGAKYEQLQGVYGTLLSELYTNARRLIVQSQMRFEAPFLGTPHLNYSKYGFSVDEGE